MNMSYQRHRFVVAALAIVLAGAMLAQVEVPTAEAWEFCSAPGTVHNKSSHVIKVKGDFAEKPFFFRVYELMPGESSNVATPLCDTDYLTVPGGEWYWFWEQPPYAANRWSIYLAQATYECVDYHLDPSKVRCRFP